MCLQQEPGALECGLDEEHENGCSHTGVSKLKLFPRVFLERVHYLEYDLCTKYNASSYKAKQEFTHGLYSVFICSFFFFFSFFI